MTNWYGYCLNNPLIYKDSSGYLFRRKRECDDHNDRDYSFRDRLLHALDEVFGGGGNGYSPSAQDLLGYNYLVDPYKL